MYEVDHAADADVRERPRTHKSGRWCAEDGCQTILSIYRAGKFCALHEDARTLEQARADGAKGVLDHPARSVRPGRNEGRPGSRGGRKPRTPTPLLPTALQALAALRDEGPLGSGAIVSRFSLRALLSLSTRRLIVSTDADSGRVDRTYHITQAGRAAAETRVGT